MTVRDIFNLRKQGKIEEAYDAIRPMYAMHKGKYTTLCMFWTAADVFKLRLEQGRTEEAAKIFKALQRVLPNINDSDGRATAFMQYAHRRLASPAVTGSPTAAAPSVLSGSPACPVLSGSPACPVLSGSPAEGLNKGQQAVLNCIRSNPDLRVPKLSELTNIPSKSIERHISALIARNLIEHRGSKKTGGYHIK